MTNPDLHELADAWPELDAAIQVQCSVCADMGERIVWADDGVPVVEECGECSADPDMCYNYSSKPHINDHRDTRMSGGLATSRERTNDMPNHTTRHSSEVKTCSKCKQEKPLSEYHRDRSRADGLQYSCKACQAETDRAWYAANRERMAESKRAYYAANRERAAETNRAWREANRERRAETKRAWREANPDKEAEHAARTRAKYPDRYAARQAVHNAVLRGELVPARDVPCTVCGEPAQEYHHHKGYSPEHTLDVMAVCITCHTSLHKEQL